MHGALRYHPMHVFIAVCLVKCQERKVNCASPPQEQNAPYRSTESAFVVSLPRQITHQYFRRDPALVLSTTVVGFVLTPPMSNTQAKRIQSLRRVFGERYPDPVRVLSVGQDVSSKFAILHVVAVVVTLVLTFVLVQNIRGRPWPQTKAHSALLSPKAVY